MYDKLLKYDLGAGAEAFSTQRDADLPYPVSQGHQVHENRVALITRPGMTREELEGYDAFITNLPGVAIGVRTADCVPILLYDPVQHVIAAIHAGWKGTVLHIAQEAINVMKQTFGSSPANMKAVIGPSIGPESFQVGEEVVEKFDKAGFPMEKIWSFHGPGNGTPMSGGHHINLWESNNWLLQQSGLPTPNIQLIGIDTYTTPAFYSARRAGPHCGRTINAISLIRP